MWAIGDGIRSQETLGDDEDEDLWFVLRMEAGSDPAEISGSWLAEILAPPGIEPVVCWRVVAAGRSPSGVKPLSCVVAAEQSPPGVKPVIRRIGACVAPGADKSALMDS